MQFTAETLAGFLSGEVVGDPQATVWTIAKIEEGKLGSLSFLANPKYESYIYHTEASVVIVNNSFVPSQAVTTTMIRVEDAYGCFAKLLELYNSARPQKVGISDRASVSGTAKMGSECYVGDFAVISDGVVMGDGCKIYPHAYIGDNVQLGSNVTLNSGVKIYDGCVIGSNVTIHAGSIIGADGFGFAPDESGEFRKIPQIGNVVIEDWVDIGANTCIDRATMGSTLIKKGVKLDNLIQIGHNVTIGENTVCAGQVGIAGSCKIGANCMLGGQVGLAGHLTLGDRVKLGSKSGVSNSVADDQTHMGYPSLPVSRFNRANAVYRNLPELSGKIFTMEKQIAKILESIEK